MHIFHEWTKWEEYKETYGFVLGILAPKEIRGKMFKQIDLRQKRKCKICGKVQDILVR